MEGRTVLLSLALKQAVGPVLSLGAGWSVAGSKNLEPRYRLPRYHAESS